jgi:hypothetical protein
MRTDDNVHVFPKRSVRQTLGHLGTWREPVTGWDRFVYRVAQVQNIARLRFIFGLVGAVALLWVSL